MESILGSGFGFLYLLAGRTELVSLLPKNGRGCEIGVQNGNFSKIIVEKATPSQLHLIDPWRHFSVTEYARDLANVEQKKQDEIFEGVGRRFSSQIRDGTVVINRNTSKDAAASLPDSYFDYIYIDGMHNYESVLSDLMDYQEKLVPGGLLMGHDFSENFHSARMGFGVVGAVMSFTRRSKFKLVAVSNDVWATFFLASDVSRGPAKEFLENLFESDVAKLRLPHNLAFGFAHEQYVRADGRVKWIPTF